MAPANSPNHTTSSIAAGIRQLAANIQGRQQATFNPQDALNKAWTVLLDLDTSRQALPDVQDRQQANRTAVVQACAELSQHHKSADAATLQQLVQEWLSATHYVSRRHMPSEAPACSSGRSHSGSQQGFAAVPLSEQQAMLSLLLALRGSCPATKPVLVSLPALGSNFLKGLQQEAQAAVTSSNSGSSWVRMSADPEELITASSAACTGTAIAHASLRTCADVQQNPAASAPSKDFSSWVSPAAAAMQLLQEMPLNAAAHVSTCSAQLQQPAADADLPDDVLIAAACATSADGPAVTVLPAQQDTAAVQVPPLLQVVSHMQRASDRTLLGRPLLLHGSLNAGSAGAARSVGHAGAQQQNTRANSQAGRVSAQSMQQSGHAVSAAAAEAETAMKAAAAVRPWVATLMHLSSAKPGSATNGLAWDSGRSSSSDSGSIGGKKDAGGMRESDTGLTKDARPLLLKQQQARVSSGDDMAVSSATNSSSDTRQELEAQLVSVACLALQGVWSAVEQLWQLVMHGPQAEYGSANCDRVYRPAAQHQLLVQVLHTAELRLRLTAFLQHYQHPYCSSGTIASSASCDSSSSSSTSSSSAEDSAVKSSDAEAIRVAFVNAVANSLSELDLSVTTSQVNKLLQQQQKGRPVSLLQLLCVQRDLSRELQQLADVCWCTVEAYVEKLSFLKVRAASFKEATLQARPSSSSSLAWQVLQRAQGARQARAAVAALQDAATAAYAEALPWPGETEAGLVLQMGWAPSTWQLKRKGIDGGYKLLERLYAGVVRAEGSAPLLRHLFAAAVQPVLQSVHSWAFLPDMQAAEAAAEVTAMASFTAGSGSSSSNPLSSGCTVGAAFSSHDTAAAAAAVAAGGPFASASQLVGAPPRNSSGGGAGGGSSKGWNGSKAAESAMRQCLQQAWHSVCARPPGCPRFLAHVQRPAGVAGMQLHLLQLLGGPGQALANRLGWLAELEQQEIQEALCAGSTAAAAHSGKVAAARTCSTPAPVAGSFMGLLSGFGPCAGDAHVSAGVRPAGQRPMCDLTSSQLKQCVAITKDYNAAREAEMNQLLLELAANRAATRHAHELWLASRQEERQEADDARSRLEAQAAARRKQRQQLLLAQQKDDIAAAQARRLGSRLQQLSLEQHLLRQSALQERQHALQQLRGELAKLDNLAPADVNAAAAAGAGVVMAMAAGGTAAAQGLSAGPFAAAAPVERLSDEALDLDSIMLDVTAEPAAAAGTTRAAHHAATVPEGADLAAVQDAQQSGQQQQQQQQQQQRQRGTWGRPLQDLGPAAGAPSGQQPAGPLAVIGSAAAAGTVQAAGRRSNSQPKVLPGMGRPVSASHSRRTSCSDEGGPGLFGIETGPDTSAAAAAASVLSAAVGGTGSRMCSATRGAAASGMSSILGGFGSAVGARGAQQQGIQTKGKWGVPVVPGAAAGVTSTLQRRASTGNLTVADVLESVQQQQQQQQQGLQRQPSGGAGYGGSAGWGGPGSRPGIPSGRKVSDTAGYDAMGAVGRQQQPMLQRQQSWHHTQQQQQLMAHGVAADGVAAAWQPAAAAAAEAAAETGSGGDVTAAAAARTGWLQSRHEHRRAEQANPSILDWLAEEIGLQQGIGSSNMFGATGSAEPNVAGATAEDVVAGQQSAAGARAAAAAAGAAAAAAAAAAGAATYGQDSGTDSSAAATARAAAPMVSALEVLVVQPILAQQRLTTVACWSLLLHEHRLLQRLSAIQGLFFQQQGDWVVLLCNALEPLLLQQQQQQRLLQAGGADQANAGSQQGGMISPVVLHLLLESAVQQSCLAGVPEAERMSLKAVSGRALLGWSSASTISSRGSDSGDSSHISHAAAAATAAGATDCLLLGYDVPWPLSLLLNDEQLQQYANIFSVLLRLRRLQQRLMKQWQPLNHRASSSAVTAAAPRRRRHASEYGPEPRRNSSSGDAAAAAAGKGARRSTWHGGVPGGLSQGGSSRGGSSSSAGDGDVSEGTLALSVGLSRLQDLRRWHALALHCVDSLLGYMLGELSGQLQGRFEAAVGARPVELPVMMEAHARLLEEARQVCFLPQQQQQPDGGGGLAGVAYAIVESAWQLQQQVAEVLKQQQQEEQAAVAGVIWVSSSSSSDSRVLAKAPSGFKEGTSCSALAAALEGDGEELWESLEVLGQRLERLLDVLKRRLKISAETAAGHPLGGLAARLGL